MSNILLSTLDIQATCNRTPIAFLFVFQYMGCAQVVLSEIPMKDLNSHSPCISEHILQSKPDNYCLL